MLPEDQAQLDAFMEGMIVRLSRTPQHVLDVCAKGASRISVMEDFIAGKPVKANGLSDACYDQCERQSSTPEGKAEAKKFELAGEWASNENDLQTGYRELKEAAISFIQASQYAGLPQITLDEWFAQAIARPAPVSAAPLSSAHPRPR